jgi:Reverse transcriptase (RNA-dependent DNA polymerase)
MMILNFPPYIIHMIKSYLSKRTFEVHLLNAISSTRPIKAGVPQGSILGPTLFNLYINDMPRSPHTEIALYADDTAIIAQSLHGKQACQYLEEALNDLEDWYEDWRIKVNVTKSNAVLFTRKKKSSRKKTINYNETTTITLFDEEIPWKKDAKYLGVTLDAKLKWNTHVTETAKKAKSRLGMLYPVLNKKSKLSLENGLTLYKTMILPILTYAAHIWGKTSKSNINKLQNVQNKSLRIITHCPWFIRNNDIHADLSTPLVLDQIKINAERFYEKLSSIPNPLIQILSNYSVTEFLKYARPKNLLAP